MPIHGRRSGSRSEAWPTLCPTMADSITLQHPSDPLPMLVARLRSCLASKLTATQTIHNALRERCHLPVKSYFCVVITDDDDIQIFSGLENLPDEAIPKFFNKQNFEQIFQRRSTSGEQLAVGLVQGAS